MYSVVRVLCAGVVALWAAGCVQSQSIRCGDGRVCGAGLACDDIHGGCVLPEQLRTCDGLAENSECAIRGELVGSCSDGVCVALMCGDGIVSGVEDCDGAIVDVTDCMQLGYYENGPVSCTASCQYDETACARRCGDGTVDLEEECDSAAPAAFDDCTEHGFYEPGQVTCRSCVYDVSECIGRCGDGIRNGDEICDGGTPSLFSCTDFGFERGRLGCSNCAADLAACRHIGWSPLLGGASTSWDDAWSAGPGHVIAVGTGGSFAQLIAGQVTTGTLPNAGDALGVWGLSANDVFVVNALGGIWRGSTGAWAQLRAPTTTTDGLRAVTGTSASDVFAVGNGQRVLHYNGSTWTQVHSGTGTLNDVWVTASGQGIAVGDGGLILRRNGSTWTSETSGTTANLTAIWGSGTDVFVVGAAGTILRYTNPGWSKLTPAPTTAALLDVHGRSPTDVYAVGDGGTTLHYDGATWWPLQTDSAERHAAVATNADETFIAGTLSTLLRQEGASWAVPAIPSGSGLFAHVSFDADHEIVAVTQGSCAMYERTETTWAAIAEPCTGFGGWDSLWAGPGDVVFAAEGDGAVHRFTGQWNVDAAGVAGSDVQGLWGMTADDVWAVDRDGSVAHWNGATWTPASIGATGLSAVHGSSSNDVYAVGWEIMHWNGTAWADVTPSTFGYWRDVWALAPNDVWVVGNEGKILHFDGATWTEWASGTAAGLEAVAGTAADDIWAVGGHSILHFDGIAWSQVRPPVAADYFDVAVREDLVVFAAWDDGLIALVREPNAW